jgi:decaprenylphospho-beta-D-erythro-pentofuranosid-2-ulose 2-reductase
MNDALGHPQTVLVLGGNSEIAIATLQHLAVHRLRSVVLAGRDTAQLERAATDLRRKGISEATVIQFDAKDTASHSEVLAEAFDRLGDVDVVILAFGILGDQDEAERDPAVAIDIAMTNYVGALSSGLVVAHRLREQGHGTLVVLSSVAGERARRSNFIYGSSKAGLDSFAQGLGDSLLASGGRVLVVRPGFVKTKMTTALKPAPFSITADEVAAVIVRALEKGSEVAWAPPILRLVMVVLRHLPRSLFRRLPI